MLAIDGDLACRACVGNDEEHNPENSAGAALQFSRSVVPVPEAEREHTTATVVESWGEFFVHLALGGKLVDVAGPFQDEVDAQLAALRNSDAPEWNAPSWARRRQRPVSPRLQAA